MVKDFLSQRGIRFEERDVSRDSSLAQEVVRLTGQMGVPVTVMDGQVIIGFNRPQLEQAAGQIQRPLFGASVADAAKLTARLGAGITAGAYIGKIKPGSLAERLGLAPGDVIVELNKRNISNADDFEHAVSGLGKGSRILLVYLRGNRRLASEGVVD